MILQITQSIESATNSTSPQSKYIFQFSEMNRNLLKVTQEEEQ